MVRKKRKASKRLQSRPPVVAVLGHVDHGKTTLLSCIKEEDLLAKESGGITQHIGAYQMDFRGKKITFIDTPGHKAFVKMRSRGAQVTDIVVLVVAADDGVMPQTKESLKHIKEVGAPFVVAINKMDLPGVSVDKVKSQLADTGVLVEGLGGKIVCVEVSAKKKKGIKELLEMILLLAQMEEFKADPKGALEAVVIESSLDAFRGPMATLLIKNGTLKTRDQIWAEEVFGKVKAMYDERGKKVKLAGPSQPIQVLGFKKVPMVGSPVTLEPGKKTLIRKKTTEAVTQETEKLKIILKADTQGTLEAIKNNLSEEVKIIDSGVGGVNESDILMAASTGAFIIDFRTKVSKKIKELAELEGVKIRSYKVIYHLFEDLEKEILKILEPTIDEKIQGEAKIIAEFTIKKEHIAGCRVLKGKIHKKDPVHLKRKEEILGTAKIKSLQREKQDIVKAKKGDEIGMVFSPELDFRLDDMIVSFSKQESR